MLKIKSLITGNNRKWWTLGTVCFALLMIVLDGNVVNLALPTIINEFGATLAQSEWINNAYLLTFAIFLITFGRLGDEIGRKKMFSAGLITFTLGSILCGLAQNPEQLIIFRVVQGLGGASMMPATLSLLTANFKKEERGGAMGLWGAVAGLGIVLGPIIGGYLTEKGLGDTINNFLGISQYWRYVFYINIPIGILALISTFTVIKESKDSEKSHNYDIAGIITSALSIFTLTYAFIEGSAYGWWKAIKAFSMFGHDIAFGSLSVVPILFLLSIIFAAIFVLIEMNCKKDPLVDLKLFKNRNFSVGSSTVSILSFAMMGSFFLLPLFLQTILGFSAIETGKNLIPFAIAIMIMSPIAGKLADKLGGKYLIVTGLAIMSFGGWLLGHFYIDTQIKDLIIPFIVMGIGMGLTQAPLNNIALLDTPDNEIGGASGVLSTTRQIGSVMGIAILGAVLQTSLNNNLSAKLDNIDNMTENIKTSILDNTKNQGMSDDMSKLENQIKTEMIQNVPQNLSLDTQLTSNLSPDQQQILTEQMAVRQDEMAQKMKKLGEDITHSVKQSFVDSINHTFKIAAIFALLGALIAFLFKNKENNKSQDY